jgi:Bacterial Ig-like domain
MLMYTTNRPRVVLALVGALVLVGSACSEDPTQLEGTGATSLVAVQPENGAVGVDVGSSMIITFDHGVGQGMAEYIHLCEGEVGGDDVPGSWMFSEGGTTMTFSPHQPLAPGTTYFIHMGGGMRDEAGELVDLERHGPGMGGQWATESMVQGGMGMGMGGQEHSGPGWRHENGSYGMFFSFSTGG